MFATEVEACKAGRSEPMDSSFAAWAAAGTLWSRSRSAWCVNIARHRSQILTRPSWPNRLPGRMWLAQREQNILPHIRQSLGTTECQHAWRSASGVLKIRKLLVVKGLLCGK